MTASDYERDVAARDHDLDHLAGAIARSTQQTTPGAEQFIIRLSEMFHLGYEEYGAGSLVGPQRAMRFTDRAAAEAKCAIKRGDWSKAIVEAVPAVRLCEECHAHPIDDGYPSAKDEDARDRLCVSCFWWTEKIQFVDESVRVNGRHYFLGPENIEVPKQHRGSYGDAYTITFTDGRVVHTTNLWTQGEIPLHFRTRIPDNAQMTRDGA